jgi:[ribosomal protein S5]-alanine N-acetyltransferase
MPVTQQRVEPRTSRTPAAVALQIGARSFLRRPTAGDEREFLARARESRPLHRGLAEPPITRPQFLRFLHMGDDPSKAIHLLCRREDGAISGVLNLGDIRREPLQSAILGYYAFVPFAGQGYMTEGVQLVLRQAFLRLKLHRVEANVQPGNAASLALARRSGFREEGYSPRFVRIGGRWRDHLRFAILIEEWRARRSVADRDQPSPSREEPR